MPGVARFNGEPMTAASLEPLNANDALIIIVSRHQMLLEIGVDLKSERGCLDRSLGSRC